MHLAQLNIGRVRAPLDDPVMQGFVDQLDPINELADASPGFVWRLQTDEGNATGVRPFEDDLLLVNLSVWEDLDTLREFVYRSAHTPVLRSRADWFERSDEAYLVLWWVPEGRQPAVEEALERLDALRRDGPTPQAFTFRAASPPPDEP